MYLQQVTRAFYYNQAIDMFYQNKQFASAVNALSDFCEKLTKKLEDPNRILDTQITTISEHVSKFFVSSNAQGRVRFTYWIQKQIRKFLKSFALPRLKDLKPKINEPLQFVQQIGQIWQNYQRFIFALRFIHHKAENTFKDFYKIAVKFQNPLMDQAKNDKNGDSTYKNQICPIPAMGGLQLKQFLENEHMIKQLTDKFVSHFCNFIKQERDGLNVPREKVNQVLQFFQSMSLDYDCDCVRVGDKLKIIKVSQIHAPANRKSMVTKYFDNTYINPILQDCGLYYKTWIQTKTALITPSEEIKQMLKFLAEEEDRAKYYIHDPKNQMRYIQTLQERLIQHNFNQRIQKPTGVKSFFANYELGNAEMGEQILNFWNVYKRVYRKQQRQKVILNLYQNYLREEAINISNLLEKPPEFIQKSVIFNKKNVEMLLIMSKPLELDRARVDVIQGLLSMRFIDNKYQGKIKQHFGSKHWAGYLNSKLKAKYGKIEPYGQNEADLAALFQLLIHKTVAINQHTKLLSFRLIEDVDMSMVNQYSNALDLEAKILEQIKRSAAQTDVKSIQGCLKDMKNSFDERAKLKQFKKMSTYGYFNQVIRKSGNHWADTHAFQIQPPLVVRPCIDTMRDYYKDKNFVFELQNGNSLFTGKFKQKQPLKFQLKNIYMMILLLIDEQKTKRMFYTDITKAIKAVGVTDRTKNELIKCLVQLNMFGVLKSNKKFGPDSLDIWQWSASDYFQINLEFDPAKKVPCFKTANMTAALPDYIRKAFQAKLSTIDQEQRKIEQDRKHVVKSKCVQLLKHSQAMDGGKGTITFEQLLNGQKRESKVDANYLKEILEHLINLGYCERLQDKRNVFKYKS